MSSLNISKSASRQINLLNYKKKNPKMLRIGVIGGGCNGFKYQMSMTNTRDSDDLLFTKSGASIIVKKSSMAYLNNSTVEYIEDLGSAEFIIKNPNSKSSCGCGFSFAL